MYKTVAQILGLRSYPVDKDKLGKEWTSMKKDDNTNKIFDVCILLDFSLTVKALTLIFISGCGSAISSAKEWKSGFIE